jgi:hypothetical protein
LPSAPLPTSRCWAFSPRPCSRSALGCSERSKRSGAMFYAERRFPRVRSRDGRHWTTQKTSSSVGSTRRGLNRPTTKIFSKCEVPHI